MLDTPPGPSDTSTPTPPISEVRCETRPYLPHRERWECKLPKSYMVAATPGVNSLHLALEIESTDDGVMLSVDGLVDCDATSDFIDSEYTAANRIPVRWLSWPILVFNVDGSPNEAGSIREVSDVILRYQSHSERVVLALTGLGKQKLILGYSWLRKHNLQIDWETREVKMPFGLHHLP
jgi:hypothetical protein